MHAPSFAENALAMVGTTQLSLSSIIFSYPPPAQLTPAPRQIPCIKKEVFIKCYELTCMPSSSLERHQKLSASITLKTSFGNKLTLYVSASSSYVCDKMIDMLAIQQQLLAYSPIGTSYTYVHG
jgi:hypothetical protein